MLAIAKVASQGKKSFGMDVAAAEFYKEGQYDGAAHAPT